MQMTNALAYNNDDIHKHTRNICHAGQEQQVLARREWPAVCQMCEWLRHGLHFNSLVTLLFACFVVWIVCAAICVYTLAAADDANAAKENVCVLLSPSEVGSEVQPQAEVEQSPSSQVEQATARISDNIGDTNSEGTDACAMDTVELQKMDDNDVDFVRKGHVQIKDEKVAEIASNIDAKMVEKSQLLVKFLINIKLHSSAF